ncbi:hypothetical protein GCM10027047_29750 [Rhodococcus aerolatus]
MAYDYEQLLDEQFQMVCQALLVSEFPGVQCLPVGMPDGGRDGFRTDPETNDRTIYQVKFSRDYRKLDDPVKWVIEAVQGEMKKIKRLIERGASSYHLIVNVPGTSHLDTGRVDRVQSFLDETLELPATCWWREDLDRRLDVNFDLKMRYPALLNGPDVLRQLWMGRGGPAAERRNNALRSYFAAQHKLDETVRFKQAELLPSPLFDLYVDVPAEPVLKGSSSARSSVLSDFIGVLNRQARQRGGDDEVGPAIMRSRARFRLSRGGQAASVSTLGLPFELGASELLLDTEFSEAQPLVVLEGAPGQGKSTLAQFMAQVHRQRLLGDSFKAGYLGNQIVNSPLKLVFKIEMRDLAVWINGRDPWGGIDEPLHAEAHSLEACLAAHVRQNSGGASFSVDDFLQVCRDSPVVVILDALDEVADLVTRQLAVDEVSAAVARLRQQSDQFSVVVTSRPTALANAPTFSSDTFCFLKLSQISPELARQYTSRWSKARQLGPSEVSDLAEMLETKLRQPHMADLASNTMQLSILLSLLHLRGPSLPDKRTELYDTYIETFLNRESEKSDVVRDNRELLIDIHRYLAFFLHAGAEYTGGSGRIGVEALKVLLAEYLVRDGHNESLVDSLLLGVVERVVALVSRTEGTYEFEVQPLREYFAARFLYDTAPYSPVGRERRGTKPDRFDGIAPNPYWLNVTRFYAGCFSKGELSDLADRVCELVENQAATFAIFPRALASALLVDLVFSQSPKSARRVVSSVLADEGLRLAILFDSPISLSAGTEGALQLPIGGGRAELVAALKQELSRDGDTDRAFHLARALNVNGERPDLIDWWKSFFQIRHPSDNSTWIRIAGWLGILDGVSDDVVDRIDDQSDSDLEAWDILGRCDVVLANSSARTRQAALRGVLSQAACDYSGTLARKGAVGRIQDCANGELWFELLTESWRFPYKNAGYEPLALDTSFELTEEGIANVAMVVEHCLDGPVSSSLAPWTTAIGALELLAGRSRASIGLAVMSAAIVSGTERGAGANNLFDETFPLTSRMRNARLRRSQLKWWSKMADGIASDSDRFLWLLALSVWADCEVLDGLQPTVRETISKASAADVNTLVHYMNKYHSISGRKKQKISSTWTEELDAAAFLVWRRHDPDSLLKLVLSKVGKVSLTQSQATAVSLMLMDAVSARRAPIATLLDAISWCHEFGGRLTQRDDEVFGASKGVDGNVIADIRSRQWSLPSTVLQSLALHQYRAKRSGAVQKVLPIARAEKWL